MGSAHPFTCVDCDEPIPERRAALGYSTCLDCGEVHAIRVRREWTIVPAGPKQGYTRVTKRADLIGIYKGSTN